MSKLDGKIAIVTGAGRGIGRGEAVALAGHGAAVLVNDLDSDPARRVVDEIVAAGGTAAASAEDVAEFDGAGRMVRQAIETWGRLDILVNNAGTLRNRMIFNMSEEDFDSIIRVHLKGHFAPTRHACAYWREVTKRTGKRVGGRIICTTSTSGLFGNAGQSNYGPAKAGITAFTQIVSLEMARYGVTCNAIAPVARTRLSEEAFEEANEVFDAGAPENVAPLVVYLASDAAAKISGQIFYVMGGTIRLYRGWEPVAEIRQDYRWTIDQLAERVPRLFVDRPMTYRAAPALEINSGSEAS